MPSCDVRLFVLLSVMFVMFVCYVKIISSNFFHRRVTTQFNFFRTKPCVYIPTGTPERGRRLQVGMKKSKFWTNISLYLGNNTR